MLTVAINIKLHQVVLNFYIMKTVITFRSNEVFVRYIEGKIIMSTNFAF